MAGSVSVEARARATARQLATDRWARITFAVAIGVAMIVWFVVGRSQWFIRDDWAFLITRSEMRRALGWQRWLFEPTAGHWMTVPLLIYRGLRNLFGLDSYWPFLSINLALHLGIVLAVRQLCRRAGAAEWTTTLVCTMLLVFGAGWENIVFAIQITCNLSLLAFLVQMLLVDHDGRVDGRDVAGSALAVVGVMSSGFGAFFLIGIGIFLGLRRRWKAMAVAVVPQALALGWWALAWGGESSEPRVPGPVSLVNTFAVRGVLAVFESLTGTLALGGVAAFATLAVILWRGPGWRSQSILIALGLTAIGMYVGLGYQRIGFGVEGGGISRYQHIGAMLLAPAFAVAVDRLRHLAPEALWAGRLVLIAAIAVNVGALHTNGSQWKIRAQDERRTFELIAGSPLAATVDQDLRPVRFSPDVSLASLAMLVADGAIVPRTPSTPEEEALVRKALGLDP